MCLFSDFEYWCSTFFFYMLKNIELKVCILVLLCFHEPKIKFECHKILLISVGVMPLLILGILVSALFSNMLYDIELKFCRANRKTKMASLASDWLRYFNLLYKSGIYEGHLESNAHSSI